LVFSGLAAVLVVAAVALAVGLTGGSSKPRTTAQVQTVPANPSGGGGLLPLPQTTPQQSTTPTTSQPSAVEDGPTYNWLGMQISDTPSGVTVATVTIGGAADTAGVDPGDVIESINNTQINSAAQLRSATAGLKVGNQLQLTVSRGSTTLTLTATLTNRPTRQ
jgi:predicted metalloprotease with PDZ domain